MLYKDLREDIKLRKKLLSMYKLHKGCAICGYNKCADALDFHHEDEEDKKKAISYLVNSQYNFAKVLREVKKCIVICANCHRELHSKI